MGKKVHLVNLQVGCEWFMSFHAAMVSWAALGMKKAAIRSAPQDISTPSTSNYSCLQAYQGEHKNTVLSA